MRKTKQKKTSQSKSEIPAKIEGEEQKAAGLHKVWLVLFIPSLESLVKKQKQKQHFIHPPFLLSFIRYNPEADNGVGVR